MKDLLLLEVDDYDTGTEEYISGYIRWLMVRVHMCVRYNYCRTQLDLCCGDTYGVVVVFTWYVGNYVQMDKKGGLRVWGLGLETIKASTFSFIFFA